MPLKERLKSAKLQFQKLDTMLFNDMKLFIRDRKSLILVMLTPFLILAILINIFYFSDVASTIRGVKIGVCDLDGSDFQMTGEIFLVTKLPGDCSQEAQQLVQKGELRGAIIIPKGFQQNMKDGKGSVLTLYLDNAKSTTALVTSDAVKAYVSDLNERIGREFILNAWEQLRLLNGNLRFLVVNLEKARPIAVTLQEKLAIANEQMSGVDFGASQQALSDVISYLNMLEIQLDTINNTYTVAVPQIPQIQKNVDISIAIQQYDVNTELLRQTYCAAGDPLLMIPNPVCTVFNYTDGIIDGLEQTASNISSYEDELNSRIAYLNAQASAINDTISQMSELMRSGSEQNGELRQKIQKAKDNLLFVQDKTENISRTIIELNQSINSYLRDIIRVTDELNETITVLDTYTQKDPATILRPVRVDNEPVFTKKLEIFYRMPAFMSIILLFITLFISSSLIVNERKGGTMARIFLSPISMFFYVFEKTLYLLNLCVLAIVSMFIAGLIFSVPIPLSLPLVIVLIIASLVYISIGVLIGAISKSENTSLLTCLVVGFPLMFLSGAFSPPELMGKIVRTISHYLPLTLNADLVEKITIYNTTIDLSSILIMVGMVIAFYLLSVLFIWKKPTLK
jgi:ABC-type multidrug transport system permease subunit